MKSWVWRSVCAQGCSCVAMTALSWVLSAPGSPAWPGRLHSEGAGRSSVLGVRNPRLPCLLDLWLPGGETLSKSLYLSFLPGTAGLRSRRSGDGCARQSTQLRELSVSALVSFLREESAALDRVHRQGGGRTGNGAGRGGKSEQGLESSAHPGQACTGSFCSSQAQQSPIGMSAPGCAARLRSPDPLGSPPPGSTEHCCVPPLPPGSQPHLVCLIVL